MTKDYGLHHHRCCRCVTNVSTSDDPIIDSSFDLSSFLIICLIDVPSFGPSHGPNNYLSSVCPSIVPSRDPSLSRGSSPSPFASYSESNLHFDDVSRVDLSINSSFVPSLYCFNQVSIQVL